MNCTNRILACLAAVGLSATGVASAQLAYNFNSVPKSGRARTLAWPFYYFSYFNGCSSSNGIGGGLAWKWGSGESPAMKFDKAFGNTAKIDTAKLDAYGKCTYKAKEACVGGHRVDQTCLKKPEVNAAWRACKIDFTVDTAVEHEVVNQGCAVLMADKWWGICHGAAAATAMWGEPVKEVTLNGVTFHPKDIQGLLASVATNVTLKPGGWIGCRNDGPDSSYSAPCTKEKAAADVTPREYHAFFGYHLGGSGAGFVADVDTGPEVWNQGVDEFSTTCTQGGTGCGSGETAYNCRTSFTYGNDVWTPETDRGRRLIPAHFTKRPLNYTLCTKDGNIVGDGKWNHDPNTNPDARQPDFLWAPGAIGSNCNPDYYGRRPCSNPYIFAKASDIINKLAIPSAGAAVVPGTEKKVGPVTVNATIKDNDATGITKTATVGTAGKKFTTLSVCLDITHTYRGDLEVIATYNNISETVKRWRDGGSAANLTGCFSTTNFNGQDGGKQIRIKVADRDAADVGTWKTFEIRYTD